MPADSDTIYSVTSLNQSVAQLLESTFAWIWVEGEISNLAQPASGHIYFSLKDAGAQIRCAMFRGRNRSLNFRPENGQQVLVRAKVSLYQPRGDYQLIVDRMEEAGDGALRRQFEELKTKLAGEGLFAEEHKQDIPELPEGIAIVTSGSGAALHDVLSVIQRRFPSIPVRLFAVPVQGAEAAPAIVRALQLIDDNHESLGCDVILLVRGGGSLEDLWPFNEESVARAIYDCSLPVVSGVGHEVDVTIADFVADKRAATPTAAAESVTPDQSAWQQTFDWYEQRLTQLMQEKIRRNREKLRWLQQRLKQQHPQRRIALAKEKVSELHRRLLRSAQSLLSQRRHQLAAGYARLSANNPQKRLKQKAQSRLYLTQRLQRASLNLLATKQARFSNSLRTLNAISPLQTLERGYSITLNAEGKALHSIEQVKVDELIETRLQHGRIFSRVESCHNDSLNDSLEDK